MPFGFGKKKEEPNKHAQPQAGKPGKPGKPQPPRVRPAAPSWGALDAVLDRRFPGRKPIHWSLNRAPGSAGLQGVRAYHEADHWFFIGYGLSAAGQGFELTIRTTGAENEPPSWPRAVLDRLGTQALESGQGCEVGRVVDLGGPITGARMPSRLCAVTFADDPELAPLSTPGGDVAFVAVVGITAEEVAEAAASGGEAVVERLAAANSLLVVDPRR
jgi:hypothetical protein